MKLVASFLCHYHHGGFLCTKNITINLERNVSYATAIRNKAIIALLYSSELRVGELVRLRPEDIYMSTMQVYVRKSKNHCDRWTLLSERALELLKEYWKSYPVKRDHLFVSLDVPHDSLKIRGVEIMLRAVGRNAGIRVHPHMLRHSFASHMIEQGVPIHFVQSMLGHRSLSSTQIYIHVSSKAVMGMRSPLDRPDQTMMELSADPKYLGAYLCSSYMGIPAELSSASSYDRAWRRT